MDNAKAISRSNESFTCCSNHLQNYSVGNSAVYPLLLLCVTDVNSPNCQIFTLEEDI